MSVIGRGYFVQVRATIAIKVWLEISTIALIILLNSCVGVSTKYTLIAYPLMSVQPQLRY